MVTYHPDITSYISKENVLYLLKDFQLDPLYKPNRITMVQRSVLLGRDTRGRCPEFTLTLYNITIRYNHDGMICIIRALSTLCPSVIALQSK